MGERLLEVVLIYKRYAESFLKIREIVHYHHRITNLVRIYELFIDRIRLFVQDSVFVDIYIRLFVTDS